MCEFAFSADEMSDMQDAQEAAMMDTGKVLVYAATTDAYGNPAETYTAGSAISCGFKPVRPYEVNGTSQVPQYDAELRLPIGTTITSLDRFQLTHRFGVDVADEVYSVIGQPKRGVSGLVVLLERVEE